MVTAGRSRSRRRQPTCGCWSGGEACGGAGSLATIERYREKGYDTLPSRGADAAITVAGASEGEL